MLIFNLYSLDLGSLSRPAFDQDLPWLVEGGREREREKRREREISVWLGFDVNVELEFTLTNVFVNNNC